MRRREFIAVLGGVAAAWPLAAHAQQPKLPTIGVVGADPSSWNSWTAALIERLRQLGWIEGRTVAFEFRWTEGRPERTAEIAAELVRLKVDIIVTSGSAAISIKQATTTIPIVFAMSPDPVGSGLVASLRRPAGNVTGLSIQSNEIAAKRLELLREAVPVVRRLGILFNGGFAEGVLEVDGIKTTARALGIETVPLEIHRGEDVVPGFDVLKSQDAQALYVVVDNLVTANRTRILTLALGARMPTVFNNRAHVRAGALMSYGPSFPDQFRRTAEVVDKILRGAQPSDIPVAQPTKFELVLNSTTAKALGLKIPEVFLARADEVIE